MHRTSLRSRAWARSVSAVAVAALMAPVLRAAPAVAGEAEDADALAGALLSLGQVLDGLAQLEELDVDVPLTALNPSALFGGETSTLFTTALASELGASFSGMGDLKTALQAIELGGTSLIPSTDALFGDVDILPGVEPDTWAITLPFDLRLPITVPLQVDLPELQLPGGDFPISMDFVGQLDLAFNPALGVNGLTIAGPPEFDLDFVTSPGLTLPGFPSVFGISNAQVLPQVQLTLPFDIDVIDLDPTSPTTLAELLATIPEDLFAIDIPDLDAGNMLDLELGISLPELPVAGGLPDLSGTITSTVLDFAEAIPAPSLDLGELDDLLNLNADELLSGFGLLAATLVGQEASLPRLPLLDAYLADLTTIADDLLSFVREQGGALVLCGSTNPGPEFAPVGPLEAGASAFCKAYTTFDPTAVEWSNLATGDVVSTSLATAGQAPTSVATFPNWQPDVEIAARITPPGEDPILTRPRFFTVQELQDLLIDRVGAAVPLLEYDPTSRSLLVNFQAASGSTILSAGETGAETGRVPRIDIGDQASTSFATVDGESDPVARGLSALTSPGSTGGVDLEAGPVSFDITIGVLLTDLVDAITPDDNADTEAPPGVEDRFYVKTDSNLLTVEDLAVSADIDLRGKLGFLDVAVGGWTGAMLPDGVTPNPVPGGQAFFVGQTTPDSPAIAVSLTGGTIPVDLDENGTLDPGEEITDAVRIRDLLDEPGAHVSLACDLDAAAALTVTAQGDLAFVEASGTAGVTLDWLPGTKPISADCATFTPPTVNTFGDYDLAFADFETDDPLELLSRILNTIEGLAASLEAEGIRNIIDTEVPLVGVSPRDLLVQLSSLRLAIDEIRSGRPAADVQCGTELTTGHGESNDRVAVNGDVTYFAVPTTIHCLAVSDEASIASASFGVIGDGTSVTDDQGEAAVGVNGELPLEASTFEVVGVLGADWSIAVTYEVGGDERKAGLPSFVRLDSLQSLEAAIENLLGLSTTPDAFSLGVEKFSGVNHLTIRFGTARCTALFEADCKAVPQRQVTVVDPETPQLTFALSEVVSDVGDFVDVTASNSGALNYKAIAQLDLALPIALSEMFTPKVLGTTGLEVGAQYDSEDLNVSAIVGPFEVSLGNVEIATGATNDGIEDDPDTEDVDEGAPTQDMSTLEDVDTDFEDLNILPGVVMSNTTQGGQCTIGTVAQHELTCAVGESISFDEGDAYRLAVSGQAHLGLGATVDNATVGDDQAVPIDDYFGGLAVDFTSAPSGAPQNCGIANPGPDQHDLTATAGCVRGGAALIADGGGVTYLGDIGAFVTTDPFTVTPFAPSDLADRFASAVLDVRYLLGPLFGLLDDLIAVLREGSKSIDVPLIGDALEAGADVVDGLAEALASLGNCVTDSILDGSQNAEDCLATDLSTAMIGLTADGAEAALEAKIDELLGDLQVGTSDVTLICSGGDCAGQGLEAIKDIRVTFKIGQGVTTCNASPTDDCVKGGVPFDLGLDGLPFGLRGELFAQAGWELTVDFGLSDTLGPYLVADGDVLSIGASLGLGDPADPAVCTGEAAFHPSLTGYDPDRCIDGELAFLDLVLQDSESNPTGLSVSTGLLLETGEADGKVALTNLGAVGVGLGVSFDANIDVRFRTGFVDDENGQFPGIVGAFKAGVSIDAGIGTGNGWSSADPLDVTDPEFSKLFLDGGSFIGQVLAPVITEVKRITGPFQPVIDTVTTPLPVLSELAAIVGEPPVTLLGLIKSQAGEDAVGLIESILEIIQLINTIADIVDATAGGERIWIDLGSGGEAGGLFDINLGEATQPLTPNQSRDSIIGTSDSGNALTGLASQTGAPPPDGDGAFGVQGLSFPVIDDTSNLFKLLLGEDVTLIRYEPPPLAAEAGFAYSFGPITVGPIPITITIGGSVGISARIAIGYDTYGLRQVIDGGDAIALLNGLFIDDLDAQGRDVPEISLTGTVYAQAAVDLVIVSAGVRGGLTFTVDLNLNDDPNPDGKLRIEELISKLANPICLFDVSGRLEAFLAAFVEIDLFFYSKEFVFELVRVVLLEFEASCEPPAPKPATPMPGNELRVNVGPNSGDRNIQEGVVAEEVTIRQLDAAGRLIQVTMFGHTEVYDVKAHDENATKWTKVIVDASHPEDDDDADVINIEPGHDDNGTPDFVDDDSFFPFTVETLITGGDGPDTLSGGSGKDTINGGPGNDTIAGRGGNDILKGGPGNDAIEGGLGNDIITGGDNDDRVSGGPGADTIDGGNHDDVINGGPSMTEADVLAALEANPALDADSIRDLGDDLTGGPGNDVLDGGLGDDILRGDTHGSFPTLQRTLVHNALKNNTALPATAVTDDGSGTTGCDSAGSGDGIDTLDGGEGNDILVGGPGTDDLEGGVGNDLLCGNAGDDKLIGDVESGPTPDDGHDRIYGAEDNDFGTGSGGDDRIFGGPGNDGLDGGDGSDHLQGGTGSDHLRGGEGNDVLFGDAGTATHTLAPSSVTPADNWSTPDLAEITFSDAGGPGGQADCAVNPAAGVFVPQTGSGDGDCLIGDRGTDLLFGENGDDIIRGGDDNDLAWGNAGEDEVHGGRGDDLVLGSGDNDRVFGDSGDDQVEGNGGNDEVFGGIGDDDLIGGSEPSSGTGLGVADGLDELTGGPGFDVIVGDNATIDRQGTDVDPIWGGPLREVTLHDMGEAGAGDDDILRGGDGGDRLFGQDGDDRLFGGLEDDYLEGNAGEDELRGGHGGDDLVGGSSAGRDGGTNDQPTGSLIAPTGLADVGDHLFGDEPGASGFGDALAGDNARITRTGEDDTNRNGPQREVQLFDLSMTGTVASAASHGPDELFGHGGDDLLFGQGSDDVIEGGEGADYAEGNGGRDTIKGGLGDDDLIGGGSAADGVIDADRNGAGLLDEATLLDGEFDDTIHGGDGVDAIAGDNARIDRLVDGVAAPSHTVGTWDQDVLRGTEARSVVLFDVATAASPDVGATGAGDWIQGDAGHDLIWGQAGSDSIKGGTGDDLVEGNAGADTINGELGHDDLIGGSTAADGVIGPTSSGAGAIDTRVAGLGDQIDGGADDDVIAGDNARILRPDANNNGVWDQDANRAGPVRTVQLFDQAPEGNDAFDDLMSNNDVIFGQDGFDQVFAQGDDDWVSGGSQDDVIEGNAGDDVIGGDADDDDLVGGSSAASGTQGPDSSGEDVSDGVDQITGGDGVDVIAGDNARITRPLSGVGLWIEDANRRGEVRDVRLFDVATVATPDAALGSSGGDVLDAGVGSDLVFGQGGDDTVLAGDGDDHVEGNDGNDRIQGNADGDDLVGGGSSNTGLVASGIGTPVSADMASPAVRVGDGLRDGVDLILGDDPAVDPADLPSEGEGQHDVITGDNARVDRLSGGAASLWSTVPWDGDINRLYGPDRQALRDITLFDVAQVGAPAGAGTSAGDVLFGQGGHDQIFGQGHNDQIHAGDGMDVAEGNHAHDTIDGGYGQDDIIGGSSAGDGHIGGGVAPDNLTDGNDTIDGSLEALVRAGDGEWDDSDVIAADNAIIVRMVDSAGGWRTLAHVFGSQAQGSGDTPYDGTVIRDVQVRQSPEPAGAFGNDNVRGAASHDELHGQQGDDWLEGNNGDDVVIGDLGAVWTVLEDGARFRHIESKAPFLLADLYVKGHLTREVTLFRDVDGDHPFDTLKEADALARAGAEGDDVILGGDGEDTLHGGPGDDTINGDGDGNPDDGVYGDDPRPETTDRDRVFGGDGDDALWGGRGDDDIFGGHHDDHIDVIPRPATTDGPADPDLWFQVASADHLQDYDYVYGGWGQDAMQADLHEPGPPRADRLIDWVGSYNVYYVCGPSYGEGTITRANSPDVRAFLADLARGRGAVEAAGAGTSGFRELGVVVSGENRHNANPIHPDSPGHFTCHGLPG